MRKIFLLMATLITLSIFSSCSFNDPQMPQKAGSSGRTLEILLAANENVYKGETKEFIDSLFEQPQVNLNQPEPMFNIVNISSGHLNSSELYKKHRNIIIVDVNSKNENKVYFSKDKWAHPQVVFQFSVNDVKELRPLFEKYFSQITQEIYKYEHLRVNTTMKKLENLDVTRELKKNFGFWITVSNEFELSVLKDNFAWVRKEAKDYSIGILIYTQPYRDSIVFREKYILNQIDSTMKQYIPGPLDGTYMAIERRVEPVFNKVLLDGRYAIETRGLWRLIGDFMGGPFVNYTFTSPDNRQLIMLTGYVYSPRKPKRDFLMQAESICQSIKFAKQ
jgi:hypothetical protein